MKRAIIVILALLILAPPSGRAQAPEPTAPAAPAKRPWWKPKPITPKDKRKLRINRIKVEGCDQIPRRVVKSILRQRKTPWYKIDPGEQGYDEFWAEDDRHRIELFYKSRGYFLVEVSEPEVVVDKRKRGVSITYRVKEGPPSRVERIEIVFEDDVHEDRDPNKMRDRLKFREGDVFELDPYQDSAEAMERFYKDEGFYRATVKRRAEVDLESLTVRVSYRIYKGLRYKLGEIKIEGCEKTDPTVVQRTMKLRSGDRYSMTEVMDDQRRVQRLPIYRTVRVIEKPDDETRLIDLTFKVEEGNPREVKVGVGYGTDEEWRAMGSWRHVNFLGGARELSVTARWSKLLEREEIKFIQPNVRRSGDFVSLAAERRVEHEEAYTHEAYSLTPTYHLILTKYLWMEVSYKIEDNQTYNVVNRLEIKEEDLAREGVLSAGKLEFLWAEVDDPINPTNGARAGIAMEMGGGPLGGNFPYYKVTAEAMGYYVVYPPVVGALRVKLGWAEPAGDLTTLPLFLRFYTGGTGMVRGFGRYNLGPKDPDNNPIGGVRLFETSLEFRYPIWEALGGVAFIDGGWVWPEGDVDYNLEDVKYASGVGIRYATPIGPLALDVAFPLEQDPGPLQYRIHFNVGQTF